MFDIRITDNFSRSVELEYDFNTGSRVSNYLITSKTRELLSRMEQVCLSQGGGAFSIIGTYGSGKSAFALFAASLLAGEKEAVQKLQSDSPQISEALTTTVAGLLLPLLVTGRRESISHALLRGIAGGLTRLSVHQKEVIPAINKLRSKVQRVLNSNQAVDHGKILSFLDELDSLVAASNLQGSFLVIDELGKLLEYAALHPKDSDVYLLQLLAERSVRRISDDQSTFIFVTILHQAIERYALRLASSQRDEWKKVQGRFEDFAFIDPVDETIRLLASAVELDLPAVQLQKFENETRSVLELTQLPAYLKSADIERSLLGAAPLSPTVSLLVGPIFRKLAQNERSLFAFLASKEPNSFMDVLSAQHKEGDELRYGLDHLFDYLISTIGPTLLHGRDSLYWAEVETILLRCDGSDELHSSLIKAIALIGYVGDFVGLRGQQELLAIVLNSEKVRIQDSLQYLVDQKLVSYRPFQEEYVLWQGSDFDLEHWLHQAKVNVSDQVSISELLAKAIPAEPLIARRHAYQSGTSRLVERCYSSHSNWLIDARSESKWADGKLIHVVASSAETRTSTLQSLKEHINQIPQNVIVSVLPDAAHIKSAAYDVLCFDWIAKNCSQLSGDPAARKELAQRRIDAVSYVETELSLLVHKQPADQEANWVMSGSFVHIRSTRELQGCLSSLFDEIYCHSPRISNELLNRKKPSASAISATKLLLRSMIEKPELSNLGIEGTPAEYGLYASILKRGELHLDGIRGIGFYDPKTDPLRISPLFDAFVKLLSDNHGQQVGLGELLSLAQKPPFGLRKGLFSILAFAFILSRKNQIALYEDSILLFDLGHYEIDRLVKDPTRFSIQLVSMNEDRSQLLELYGKVVGLDQDDCSVLQVVTALLRKARTLSPYARRTGDLSKRDTAVREALFRAEDPIKLLFEDIPIACGRESELEETHPENYPDLSTGLESSLRAITNAYQSLLFDIQDEIAKALHLHAHDPEGRRTELVERSKPLLQHATNDKFRAFLVRATDAVMDTSSWFESLAALLSESPPKHWLDRTRDLFRENLREIARSFQTLEPLVFSEPSRSPSPGNNSILGVRKRISVTSLGREELARVFSTHPEDESLIDEVAQELSEQLALKAARHDNKFQLSVITKLLESLMENSPSQVIDTENE